MPSPKQQPLVFVACQVMQDLLGKLLPAHLAERVTFMDYGLHRFPNKMAPALQTILDAIPTPSLVVLGYGLCGNGLAGLQARQHTLLVPRADDCIAILLGSREAYLAQFNATPGTYYLSKGWLESGSNPLREYEEYIEKYGAEDAAWIMDRQYEHYERLVLVAHSQADLEKYRPQALEVARYCEQWGMRYEEILGSDLFVRRLVAAAAAPETAGPELVLVPPGGQVRQEYFLDMEFAAQPPSGS